MANYFTTLAEQAGVAIWLLIVILIWSLVWKLLALWKSARKGHTIWFIVMAVINTVGILPILYIFVFSKMKYGKPTAKPVTAKKKKK